jgi:hypothetical protein
VTAGRGVVRPTRLRVFLLAIASIILLPAPPARPAELTGTWRGTVTVDGEQVELTLDFSDNDYFLCTYTNSSGFVRTVELSGPGQFQSGPPRGGVLTLAVESVVKRPDGIAYLLHTGFERASNGYLDQQYVSEEADYAITPRACACGSSPARPRTSGTAAGPSVAHRARRSSKAC